MNQKTFCGANILLPKEGVDFYKWSVVACDQFTSEPEYWAEVEKQIGDAPSTYSMILPEVYLEDPDAEKRIGKINQTMDDYLNQGIFEEYNDALIYVERIDSTGKMRAGLVGQFDLEKYDYNKGSTSLIRATEATVTSRIPPRIKVRQNAKMELPHIMILIDDDGKTVIEPLANKKSEMKVVYDTDLMQGGGHITGYLVDSDMAQGIYDALAVLSDPASFNEKYNLQDTPVLLYAMGDGNHSLATAKEYYESLKREHPEQDFSNHPARYALAELVNLHSDALEFEAIHRIVTDVDVDDLLDKMTNALKLTSETEGVEQCFEIVKGTEHKKVAIGAPTSKLTVGSLQMFLDEYLANYEAGIDYIHGIDVIESLSAKEGSIGFVLPDMGKEELFPTVILDGALPRKTFSMGHAQDKRYYMECRKIR